MAGQYLTSPSASESTFRERVFSAPVVIIPFGDSTTAGKAPGSAEGGSLGGGAWRTGCWQRLVAPGNTVTFVGQYTSGATDALAVGTGRHEGLSGIKLDTLTATMATQIAAAQAVPTAITLLAGINDIDQGEGASLSSRMTTALDTLRAASGMSQVPIFVANLMPTSGKSYDAEVATRSAALTTLILARTDRCYLVNSYAALTTADINDAGIHPTSQGYAKLGRAFANRMFEVIT